MSPESTVSSTGRPLVRALRYLLPLVLLGLAVHVLLPQIATFERSFQVVRGMALWAVALAVAMQVLSYLGSGYLLKTLVAVVGQQLPLIRGTLIFTAASTIGLVAGGPVGNAAATFRWMRGSGVDAEGAALAGSLPTLFYSAALMIVGIFGLVHLLLVHELSALQAVGFGLTLLILVLVAGVAVVGGRNRSWLEAMAVRLAKRWAALRSRSYDAATTLAALGRWYSALGALRNTGWRGPMLGAALNTAFDILTLYFLFVAAGHPVSPGVLLTGYGLPLLLGKVSFLPGGVGIVEATMAALYNSLGVPDNVTVVVILIYRFLSFWLPLLVGLPLIPYLQHTSHHVDEGGSNDPVR
jgi:uncharacterized protein (TIRG00374 family)